MNEIGKVSIKLIADTNSFFTEIKKAIASAENLKSKISIDVDTSKLESSIKSSLASISKLKSTSIGISADESKLQSSVTNSLSKLSSIKSTKISITADNSDLIKDTTDSISSLAKIQNKNVAINVADVDAINAVDAVKTRLELLQDKANKLSIKPNVDDSQVKALELQIGTTKKRLETLEPSFLNSAFTTFGSVAGGVFSNLKTGIEDTINSTKTFGLIVGGSLTAGLVALGTNGIKTSADLSSIKTSLTVLTGSAETATQIFKDTYEQSLISPNTFQEIANARKTLIGFGSTVDDSKDQISTLLDVAGATGGDFGRLALVFGQVNAAGHLMGGDALQLINNNLPIATILSKKLGVSIADVQAEMQKGNISAQVFNEALKDVTKEGGFAFGGALKQSKTLAGEFSTLQDGITQLGLRFVGFGKDGELQTGGIADKVLKLVDSLNFGGTTLTSLGDAFAKVGDKVGGLITLATQGIDNLDFSGVGDVLSGIIDVVVILTYDIIALFKSAGDFVGTLTNSVGGISNFVEILKITAITIGIITGAVTLFEAVASPMNLAILLIVGSVTALAAILGNGDITKGLKVITDTFTASFDYINGLISSFAQTDLVNPFGFLSDSSNLTSAGTDVDNLKGKFSSLKDTILEIPNAIGGFIDTINNAVGGANNLNAIILTLATSIGVVALAMNAGAIATAVLSTATGILTATTTAFGIASAIAFSPITLTVGAIALAFLGLSAILGGGDIQKGIGVITDSIKSAFNGVMDFFNAVKENSYVKDFFGSLGDIFNSLFSIISNLAIGVYDLFKPLIDVFVTVGKYILDIADKIHLAENAFNLLKVIGTTIFVAIISPIVAVGVAIYGIVKAVQFTIGIIKDVVGAISGFFRGVDPEKNRQAISDAIGGIGESFNKLGKDIVDGLAQIPSKVSELFGNLGGIINDSIGGAGASISNAVKGFVKPFTDFVGNIKSKFTKLWDSLSGNLPSKLGQLLGLFASWNIDVIKNIAKFGIDFIAKIGDAMGKVLTNTKNYLGNLYDNFEQTFINIIQNIIGAKDTIIQKAIEIGTGIVNGVISYILDLPNKVANLFNLVISTLGSFIESGRSKAIEIGSAIVTTITDFISTLPDRAFNYFTGLITTIGSFIEGVRVTASAIGSNILTGITDFVSKLPENLGNAFNEGLKKLAQFGEDMKIKALEIGTNIVNGIINGIKSIGGGIGKAVGDATGNVGNVAQQTAGTINDFFSGFAKSFHFAEGGKVPQYLVSGGYSKGTDTVPTMLTPGEFVVNKDSTSRFAGILESINNAPDKFGELIRNAGNSSNVNNYQNNTRNNNISVNIERIDGSTPQIMKNVNNIGYLLQSELLNRGVL